MHSLSDGSNQNLILELRSVTERFVPPLPSMFRLDAGLRSVRSSAYASRGGRATF